MKKTEITLQDAFKSYTLDQDKVISPDETVKRLRSRLETVNLDILENTMRIDSGRLDIPVYFSTCGKDALSVIGTKKQMGKGATPTQAEASAVMELAERFSFFSFCNNPNNFFVETPLNIKEKALSFDMIAKSVHDGSEDLDAARKLFQNLPLKWTWGYNLTRQEPVLVPFDWFYAINEFNGPSAGNCREEALSQGICEIVERHVSSIVSQDGLRVPGIRVDSPTDEMVLDMIAKYNRNGIKLFLSDFSLDMGIPSVGALAYDPATFPQKSEIVWTAGTTPDPQKALSRALTEVAQLGGDFNSGSNYVASGLPKFTELNEAESITHPGSWVSIQDLPDLSDSNIKTEVENMVGALSANGFEVIVIDTKHEVLDVPAFYTIIPGARFRERALGTSVAMFSARLILENNPAQTALNTLEQMDRTIPGKYFIKFNIGSCLSSMGEPDKALEYYRKALELHPNQEDVPSIYSYMGVCYKDMGEYRQALRILEKGARLDSARTDIFNLMGFCHFMLKEHEQAIACFKQVIELDPGSAIDYANIASNYRDMGKTDKAIDYYQTALNLDPSLEFARTNLKKLLS